MIATVPVDRNAYVKQIARDAGIPNAALMEPLGKAVEDWGQVSYLSNLVL